MSEHAVSGVGDKHSGPRRHGALSILTTLLLLVACNGEEPAGTAPAGDDVAVEADEPESADTDFPEDDIRWIIPASAGGGLDVTSRQVQPYWEEELGVSLVIDNQEGGNFAIGATAAHRAEPDCHTILFHIDPILHFSYMTQEVPYTYDDFYPIGRFTIEPSVLRVGDDAPWDTIEEFIEDARQRPGEIAAGVGGLTSNQYIAFLQLEEAEDIDLNVVPYDGGGAARVALVADEVEVIIGGVFNSQNIADESRVLTVLQEENLWPDLTDDAPTIREALDNPDIPHNSGDYGVFVQAECREQHPERFQVLVDTFQAAAESEAFHQSLEEVGELDKLGVTPPEEFEEQMRESEAAVRQVIEDNPELQEQ